MKKKQCPCTPYLEALSSVRMIMDVIRGRLCYECMKLQRDAACRELELREAQIVQLEDAIDRHVGTS